VRRRRQNSGGEGGNSAGWLTTFNDLVTLLMVFFVLLFAMSSVDAKKIQDFQNALQSGLGILKEGRMVNISIKTTQPVEDMSHIGTQPEGVKTSLQKRLTGLSSDALMKSLEADFGIQVTHTHQGIRLSFEDQILFNFGKAGITRQAMHYWIRSSRLSNGCPMRCGLKDIPTISLSKPHDSPQTGNCRWRGL